MTRTGAPPVLVTGATGRVGGAAVDLLLWTWVCRSVPSPVAPKRRPRCRRTSKLSRGASTVPESLYAGLQGVSAVFLVGPPRRRPPRQLSELLQSTLRASSFSPRLTERRTRSSSNRIRWLYSTQNSNADRGLWTRIDDHQAGDVRVERVVRWAAAIRAEVWSGGLTALPTAPVDERDVAGVAARTLYQDGHAGGDDVLTGPGS